ncbi:PQ-loop-domain-containing protein [Gautieria morchelliformis]|nr:PQ-loop-domain-containing protein [Gautieria morchelliformis]
MKNQSIQCLTPNSEVLSNVLGWISIGCWIIVYSPQFIENYQLKSGEGLSVAFVLVWLVGDLTNLLGAVLAGLLPTIIVLAVYYSLCDIGLLCQIYYYRQTHPVHLSTPEQDESTRLLPSSQMEHPAHRPRYRRLLNQFAPYGLGILFVLTVGAAAYWINTDQTQSRGGCPKLGKREDLLEWKSQLSGWVSAVLYLGSRIPQISKNVATKCVGLSPVLFFFAIAGNATYVASILVVSIEPRYLAVNASWLAGSGLTIFLDLVVLAQFIYFRTTERVFVPDASQAPDP